MTIRVVSSNDEDFHLAVFGDADLAGDSAPHHVALAHGDRHRRISHVTVTGCDGDGLEALTPELEPRLGRVRGVDAQSRPRAGRRAAATV